MSTLGIVLGVLVLLVVLLVFWLIATYNGFVRGRVRVDNGYAQIDVQLKRRYDLIPNLVETVKGYAAHERQTLEAVIKARQQAIDASGVKDQAMAENLLTGALRQIFALSERYPDLKANANFAQLQEELVSTENKISFARQHYNDVVTGYNMSLAVFPSNLVAGMFSFQRRDFFETEAPSERQAPKVQF
ncbi:MAG: LemA family protein [Phycisphaeraceae bacterium]|nr:LemA family protein [Phycisphaeraceae bacterium]